MMRVAIAGDWHGSKRHAVAAIDVVADHGIRHLLHLGDFGIWPGVKGERFLAHVTDACAAADVTIYITAGNHDDWPQIYATPLDDRDDIGPCHWMSERIAVLPRGHRFTLGGRSFVSLGGAPSIDRADRFEGLDWWPEEIITDADVDLVVGGGTAEVILLHDSPSSPWCTDAVAAIQQDHTGWNPAELYYCAIGRSRVTRAVKAVVPKLVFHGHFHVLDHAVRDIDGVGHPVEVYSLPQENRPGNLVFLDLTDLTVST